MPTTPSSPLGRQKMSDLDTVDRAVPVWAIRLAESADDHFREDGHSVVTVAVCSGEAGNRQWNCHPATKSTPSHPQAPSVAHPFAGKDERRLPKPNQYGQPTLYHISSVMTKWFFLFIIYAGHQKPDQTPSFSLIAGVLFQFFHGSEVLNMAPIY